MSGWLVGWFVGWMVCCLGGVWGERGVGWLVGWLFGWLLVALVGWLVGWLVGLVDWKKKLDSGILFILGLFPAHTRWGRRTVGWLVGLLAGRFVGLLLFWSTAWLLWRHVDRFMHLLACRSTV